MAQVLSTEPPCKWCKVTLNNKKADFCLLASCKFCPPRLQVILIADLIACMLKRAVCVLTRDQSTPTPSRKTEEYLSSQILLLDKIILMTIPSASLDMAERRALDWESLINDCLSEDG